MHELGHFLAARRHGVRVLIFSLGFGPKILKVTRGDTEHRVSAILLGGYVKMVGENPEDPRSDSQTSSCPRPSGSAFQILFAGPAMNILRCRRAGVRLLAGAQMFSMEQPPVIGAVLPDFPAAQAGIRRNDRILTVAGREVATPADLQIEIGTRRPNRDVGHPASRWRNRNDGSSGGAGESHEYGDIGVLPNSNPIVDSVTSGDIAQSAGFQAGDIVLAINGDPVVTSDHQQVVGRIGEQESVFTIRRGISNWNCERHWKDRGDGAKIGLHLRSDEAQARTARSGSHERRTKHQVVGPHLPDACGPVHRSDVGSSAPVVRSELPSSPASRRRRASSRCSR